MFGLGYGELLIVLAIVLLIFGGKKIPTLMGAFGEGIKNFKKGVKEPEDADSKKISENSDSADSKKDS